VASEGKGGSQHQTGNDEGNLITPGTTRCQWLFKRLELLRDGSTNLTGLLIQ